MSHVSYISQAAKALREHKGAYSTGQMQGPVYSDERRLRQALWKTLPGLAEFLDIEKEHRFWYLASPYTHPHQKVRRRRYKEVSRLMFELLRRDIIAWAPIATWHPIEEANSDAPLPSKTYALMNASVLFHAHGLLRCEFPGHDLSDGMYQESRLAVRWNKPIVVHQGGPDLIDNGEVVDELATKLRRN